MSYDLNSPLVIGISSRVLFDLEEENRIFEEKGLAAYEEYQIRHEKDILKKGRGFSLVEAFLGLNRLTDERLVEVVIMSRNNPNVSLRIFNSIEHYGLDITRAVLTSGAPISPYLKAFRTDLFLSAYEPDVIEAINDGVAAGLVLRSIGYRQKKGVIRIAFDGDAVLFSPESERIYQKDGMTAFIEHEQENADTPMEKGPFANFLMAIAHIQSLFREMERIEHVPIRTALVTSRNAPAHERAVKTLRNWGVRIDEAFFLGGVSKRDVLEAFGADIFFDDQHLHTDPASEVVTSAVVPYREGEDPTE